MRTAEWDELEGLLRKFLNEEKAEPEHAEDAKPRAAGTYPRSISLNEINGLYGYAQQYVVCATIYCDIMLRAGHLAPLVMGTSKIVACWSSCPIGDGREQDCCVQPWIVCDL